MPGGEGVGVVRATGCYVTTLKEGDWVIPAMPSLGEYQLYNLSFIPCYTQPYAHVGMWRTMIVDSAKQFMRVRADMDLETAATLSVNPTTAYRMLRDYVQLSKG